MTRILVIDDDVTHAELMRVVLEDAEYRVSIARSASDLPDGQFSCVVTDLVTIGAYSFEDARDWILRLRDRYPAAPILVTSAHREVSEDADRLGVSVIVKPFDIDTFAETVREITS